jgi:hypothetical protein
VTVKQNLSHSVKVEPFSCSDITIREISVAQVLIVQNSSRITSEGYPNCYCPYQSAVRVEQIV